VDEEQKKRLREQAQREQCGTLLADVLPPLIRRMYENFLKEGFNPENSLALCQTWILGQCPHGVRGIGP
jgi:hypothetical protein